jgi:hypothetical protein
MKIEFAGNCERCRGDATNEFLALRCQLAQWNHFLKRRGGLFDGAARFRREREIDADADDHGALTGIVEREFAEHAAQLAAIEQKIVGPLQLQGNARRKCFGRCETAGQRNRTVHRTRAHEWHCQREQQRRTRPRMPGAAMPTASSGLLDRGAQDRARRLPCANTTQKIRVRRPGSHDGFDIGCTDERDDAHSVERRRERIAQMLQR